jgi:hypothetical protein
VLAENLSQLLNPNPYSDEPRDILKAARWASVTADTLITALQEGAHDAPHDLRAA